MTVAESNFDPFNLQGQYAGFVTRFVAFLLDLLILSGIYSISAVVLLAIGSFFQQDFFALARDISLVGVLATTVAAIVPMLYYVFFWALIGQTPGKAFMGIRIYTLDGGQLSLRRAFVRYVCYWLSATLMFTGFLFVLVDNRRQTLHDKIAKTVVVYAWEARMHRLVVERARRGIRSRS